MKSPLFLRGGTSKAAPGEETWKLVSFCPHKGFSDLCCFCLGFQKGGGKNKHGEFLQDLKHHDFFNMEQLEYIGNVSLSTHHDALEKARAEFMKYFPWYLIRPGILRGKSSNLQ